MIEELAGRADLADAPADAVLLLRRSPTTSAAIYILGRFLVTARGQKNW